MSAPKENTIQDARYIENETIQRLVGICGHRSVVGPSAAGTFGPSPIQAATWGDYHFALNGSNLVLVKGERLHLHPRQFAVAFTFFCNLEQAVSQEFLLNSYWKSSRASDPSRALSTCVSQIRTHLSLDRKNEFKLLRLSGRNYKLTAQPLSWC
ncbi:helix-turn-helix domain-containing protein [Variovorax sp. CCNWLW186]|jgi:hypothetical protein|uniref:winged helix-turn-helix domain-containing protein n=1 Tax=Variovorax sp. CCNWLW186 TaxID=3127473 RepID=UPI003077C40A